MLIPENQRRLFLAVAVPSETLVLLEELKRNNPSHPALKWMRVQNLHLTIFFIGNVKRANYDVIADLCKINIAQFNPFILKFGALALMPSAKPRMVWAKYHCHEEFTSLYHSINKILTPYLSKMPDIYEQPVPHITLARFHGLKQTNVFNLPKTCFLPDIYIDRVFIWETESNSGQSDYIQNSEVLSLNGAGKGK